MPPAFEYFWRPRLSPFRVLEGNEFFHPLSELQYAHPGAETKGYWRPRPGKSPGASPVGRAASWDTGANSWGSRALPRPQIPAGATQHSGASLVFWTLGHRTSKAEGKMIPILWDPKANREADPLTPQRHHQGNCGMGCTRTGGSLGGGMGDKLPLGRAQSITHQRLPQTRKKTGPEGRRGKAGMPAFQSFCQKARAALPGRLRPLLLGL